MNPRGNRTTNSRRLGGFALPTILIASIIMLTVLLVAVTSTAAVRVALVSQYYNQLSQTAGEAGAAYAKSCLTANNGTPWTNPLKPDTDCTGAQLASCPLNSTDAACHFVMVNGNIRTTFAVDVPQLVGGNVVNINSVGSTKLLRSSDNSIWRQYSQPFLLVIPPPTTYTLTTIAGTNGTVSSGGTYNTGSTPTITATPNTNYAFSSWTGSTGCSGVASHTITMDAAKSCTANFVVPSPYIQTITAASCPSTRTQVQDARDSHTYWVQKLADNKCWMLTNLGYAGGGTNTYSDIKTLTNGTGGSETYTVASYYVTPSTTNFTTEPTAPSTSTTGSGQYGYLYNWCAATGAQLSSSGCSSTITTPLPVTTASICPSGWRLPTGNGGEFGALNTVINGGSTTTDAGLIGAPWLAQRGGVWSSGFSNQGSGGYYWSSTQYSATNASYSLVFTSIVVNPAGNYIKSYGLAVRCIAV